MGMAAGGYAGMIGQAGAQVNQAMAARTQGMYADTQFQIGSDWTKLEAADALRRGERRASQVAGQASRIQGAQIAAAAANGVDASTGSAAAVASETGQMGDQDALTARLNAAKEALSYKAEASNLSLRGRLARRAGINTQTQGLLTAGLGVMKDYNQIQYLSDKYKGV